MARHLAHHLRNDEQTKAFDEWWTSYMKQYFAEQASKVERDGNAMWIIGIAYQAGLEKMAHTIQDALSLATVSTTSSKEV